jgi:hypothetical protein
MPYGSEPHLPVEVGSDTATCLAGPYGPRDSTIKKSLVGLSVQLGMHVPNTRTHVSMSPHVSAIMRLQDVQAGSVVNTCKVCEQTSTVWLQCAISTVNHSSGTATVPK